MIFVSHNSEPTPEISSKVMNNGMVFWTEES